MKFKTVAVISDIKNIVRFYVVQVLLNLGHLEAAWKLTEACALHVSSTSATSEIPDESGSMSHLTRPHDKITAASWLSSAQHVLAPVLSTEKSEDKNVKEPSDCTSDNLVDDNTDKSGMLDAGWLQLSIAFQVLAYLSVEIQDLTHQGEEAAQKLARQVHTASLSMSRLSFSPGSRVLTNTRDVYERQTSR